MSDQQAGIPEQTETADLKDSHAVSTKYADIAQYTYNRVKYTNIAAILSRSKTDRIPTGPNPAQKGGRNQTPPVYPLNGTRRTQIVHLLKDSGYFVENVRLAPGSVCSRDF
ncbi:MAG: hypothetical protein ACRC10_02635 [Thermoguttaceae bacterium]